jgi:hypothetical protein
MYKMGKQENRGRFVANAFGVADEFKRRNLAQSSESDPAVVAKLMTAELHPFSVHLQRKKAP